MLPFGKSPADTLLWAATVKRIGTPKPIKSPATPSRFSKSSFLSQVLLIKGKFLFSGTPKSPVGPFLNSGETVWLYPVISLALLWTFVSPGCWISFEPGAFSSSFFCSSDSFSKFIKFLK